MGRQVELLKKDQANQYYRQIGRKEGVAGQAKFRLGGDITLARIAYAKLGRLWEIVEAEHKQRDASFAQVHMGNPNPPQRKPASWEAESLAVAEAIRKHQNELTIAVPELVHGDAAYATYINHFRQRFGSLVMIVPADPAAAERGALAHAVLAEDRARKATLSSQIAGIPIPVGLCGQTFYQAIDGFVKTLEDRGMTESIRVEIGHAKRLKHSLTDLDLGQLKLEAMQKLRNYWAARPDVKLRSGRPSGRRLSLSSVSNHIDVARRFFKWLDRSDAYQWEMPRYGLDELKVNSARLLTHDEIAKKRRGVKTFKVEDLTIIFKYATDLQRLFILLGLNCAMAQGEIITLHRDELYNNPPAIKRFRRKSQVYGEFTLWDETVAALAWWERVRPSSSDLVLVTGNGAPYTRQRISNIWAKLHNRIERQWPGKLTEWHSFKHLRKTSAQFVRNIADGEVAAVLLCHGQPVEADDLSDVYSNRPFDKVAAALSKVRQQLAPMFAAAPTAFTSNSIGNP